jgi:hypothetical protein
VVTTLQVFAADHPSMQWNLSMRATVLQGKHQSAFRPDQNDGFTGERDAEGFPFF